MQGTQRVMSAFLLIAFALVAISVVCLASGQPTVMSDCGNQMTGFALCPFMSASLPMITVAFLGKEMAAIIAIVLLVVVAAFAAAHRFHFKEMTSVYSRRNSERPSLSFLNPTLRLISQGILHSRVFDY